MSELHEIPNSKNFAKVADVVFIHGLGGDAWGTWRHGEDESTSWPHWVAEEFPNVAVWTLGYASSASKWSRLLPLIGKGSRDSGHSMALPTRANQVLDRMVQRGLGKRPLLFVGHSLGGLLTKHILRKSKDSSGPKESILEQTRGVLFLATPHAGSEWATIASLFSTAFQTTVSIEDLRQHGDYLADVSDWYRKHSSAIRTVTYYEGRPVKGALRIVNRTSSHPGVGEDPIELDEDHVTIAKPRRPGEQVCDALRDLLRPHIPETPPETPPHPNPPSRIPCELPPEPERLFGRDGEVKRVAERLLAARNTAIVGPAGLGKTAVAATALAQVVGRNGVNLASSPYPDGVVYLDLYAFHGMAEPAWNWLISRVDSTVPTDRSTRDRAVAACRARRILVVIEGGEEADGTSGRASLPELFSVFSPENRWLLLTRETAQAPAEKSVSVSEALSDGDAGDLLDSLTKDHPLKPDQRQAVLDLLQGHPLALNWAGNLLNDPAEDRASLIRDWNAGGLPGLRDPKPAERERTLEWLYGRSVRGLDARAKHALHVVGLLAHGPVPAGAIDAALGSSASGELKALAHRGLLRRLEDGRWQCSHVLSYQFARAGYAASPTDLKRLGEWLHKSLLAELETHRNTGGGTTGLGSLLQHAGALVRAKDDEQKLWRPLVIDLLYDIADRLKEIGRLDLAAASLTAVSVWRAALAPEKLGQSFWQREHSTLLNRQGNVLRDQGDLGGALSAYRESLQVSQRLAAADPSNATSQRDLSVSLNNVGNVLREQGDLGGALSSYRESLQVRQRLAAADPSNATSQRDLSISLNNVGNVLRDQGDLGGALSSYRESLQVSQRLAAADPSNATSQRDLSVSLDNVGNVLRDQGDLGGALSAYRESLQVSQRLAAADPSNATSQRDLSVSLNNVGNVLLDQGDLGGALSSYRESLQVSQRLAAADPSNATSQRDLLYSYWLLADLHQRQADGKAALEMADSSLRIAERLSALDSTNATWRNDVQVTRALVARLRAGE